MQIIGFNLTKLLAEKSPEFKRGTINTNIEFTNLEKSELDLLKDSQAVNISFIYTILYETENGKEQKKKKQGEVSIEGNIIISVTKEQSKNLQKAWKKKTLDNEFKLPLFNFILRKCSIKAAQLEDDIGLPVHIPIPRISPKNQ